MAALPLLDPWRYFRIWMNGLAGLAGFATSGDGASVGSVFAVRGLARNAHPHRILGLDAELPIAARHIQHLAGHERTLADRAPAHHDFALVHREG